VDGSVALRADGMAIADLTVNDSTGRSIDGLGVTVRLVHPTNRKLDREIVMAAAASGRYRGSVEAMPGQWDFVVELDRDGERSFNSRTRVTLK
jgi:nitrogen fixation protein FixH